MKARFGAIGPSLHRAGWEVIPIKEGTKRCLIEGWQRGFTTEQIDQFAANGHANDSVGLLARQFPGADIDVLDAECADAIEALIHEELGEAPVRYGTYPKRLLVYATDAPFKKVKVFLTGPNGDKGADGKDYAVEFLGDGQQYLIFGRHPSGNEYDWVGTPPGNAEVWEITRITLDDVQRVLDRLPEVLPAGWSVRSKTGTAVQVTDDPLAYLKQPLDGWPLDRVVEELLPHLDPNCGYEEWMTIGMALHHQSQGELEWLEVWDQWSADSSKYAEGLCQVKWDSFSEQRMTGAGAVTLASLLHKTKPARQELERSGREIALDAVRQALAEATDARQLQEEIAPQIRNIESLIDVDREVLAGELQRKGRELGVRLPIGTIRRWLTPRGEGLVAERPEWSLDWVYVTEGDKFFNLATKQEVTPAGFRALFNREMPFNMDGGRERADVYALEQWGMDVVSHKAYMPNAEPVFEMFGLHWVNLYRPESVPRVPAKFSTEELAAIDVVQGHLNTYLADQRERDLLLSFMAHNVQHPGVKVRWAPYIHGVPGDGKSFFSELVAVAMGGQNVRSLNGSTLESNFTDWAVGYALIAVEEMKQHGHNRYDIMNRVKPFITNTSVEIHPKGKASYTAPNVSNYIIFSNYLDGAPVDAGDRRYMFVSSQLTTADAMRLTTEGYFKRLFDAIHAHPGAIRKWLLGVAMHPEFDANGRAPDTEVKHTVVEMSKSELEMLAEDLIESGADGVCADVISSAHLVRALTGRGADAPASHRVNTLLTQLGYRFAWRKKWRGEACRVWIRQGVAVTDEKALELLNKTSVEAFGFLE